MGQDGSMQVFNSSTNIQTMAPGADGTIWLFRQTNSYADDGTEGTSISELIQLDAHGTLLRTITPVSYTHLDVYKRQAPGTCVKQAEKSASIKEASYKVSYSAELSPSSSSAASVPTAA